jgi:hypothetical protein
MPIQGKTEIWRSVIATLGVSAVGDGTLGLTHENIQHLWRSATANTQRRFEVKIVTQLSWLSLRTTSDPAARPPDAGHLEASTAKRVAVF